MITTFIKINPLCLENLEMEHSRPIFYWGNKSNPLLYSAINHSHILSEKKELLPLGIHDEKQNWLFQCKKKPWSGPRHTKGDTWSETDAYKEKSEELNSTVSHSNHALAAHGVGLPHSAEVDSPSPPPSRRCCRHLPQPHRGRAAPPSARPTRRTHDVDLCLERPKARMAPAPASLGSAKRQQCQVPGAGRCSGDPEDDAHVRQRVPTTLSDSDPGRLPLPAPWTQPKTWRASWSLARDPLTTPSSPTPRSRCQPHPACARLTPICCHSHRPASRPG